MVAVSKFIALGWLAVRAFANLSHAALHVAGAFRSNEAGAEIGTHSTWRAQLGPAHEAKLQGHAGVAEALPSEWAIGIAVAGNFRDAGPRGDVADRSRWTVGVLAARFRLAIAGDALLHALAIFIAATLAHVAAAAKHALKVLVALVVPGTVAHKDAVAATAGKSLGAICIAIAFAREHTSAAVADQATAHAIG